MQDSNTGSDLCIRRLCKNQALGAIFAPHPQCKNQAPGAVFAAAGLGVAQEFAEAGVVAADDLVALR